MSDSPAFGSGKFQRSVVGMRVTFHGNPANLDDTLAVAADAEMHRVRLTILRQMRTVAGISEVATLPEFLVRRCDTLMSGSGAVPGKPIAQRQSSTVRPQLGIVPSRRKEVRTGQESSQKV